MALNRITQFAGESFNTKDNVRTVYVGQAEGTPLIKVKHEQF